MKVRETEKGGVKQVGAFTSKASGQVRTGTGTAIVNRSGFSPVGARASTQQQFLDYAPRSLLDLYGQMSVGQRQTVVSAFGLAFQSPGAMGRAATLQNVPPETLFNAAASPDQLAQYAQATPAQQQSMQASMFMSVLSGDVPIPQNLGAAAATTAPTTTAPDTLPDSAPPALVGLYNQLTPDQHNSLVAAFNTAAQSPGAAGRIAQLQTLDPKLSADALFRSVSTPAEVDVYNGAPPDLQQAMQADTVLGLISGDVALPNAPTGSALAVLSLPSNAPPSVQGLYSQVSPSKGNPLVRAFNTAAQTPGAADRIAALQTLNLSAEAVFRSVASPAQLSQYNILPPDQKKSMQVNTIMGMISGEVPMPLAAGIASPVTASTPAMPQAMANAINTLPANEQADFANAYATAAQTPGAADRVLALNNSGLPGSAFFKAGAIPLQLDQYNASTSDQQHILEASTVLKMVSGQIAMPGFIQMAGGAPATSVASSANPQAPLAQGLASAISTLTPSDQADVIRFYQTSSQTPGSADRVAILDSSGLSGAALFKMTAIPLQLDQYNASTPYQQHILEAATVTKMVSGEIAIPQSVVQQYGSAPVTAPSIGTQLQQFMATAPPAVLDLYNQATPDEKNVIVGVFGPLNQDPAAQSRAAALENISAEAVFQSVATPSQRNLYNMQPPTEKRDMQIEALAGILSGDIPVPALSVGSASRPLAGFRYNPNFQASFALNRSE